MNDFTPESPVQPFKDRKTLLVAFGVVQLCFGLFCALLTVMIVAVSIAAMAMGEEAARQGMQAGSMFMGAVVYGLVSAWFLTMGYGSIRARRWARSLTLSVCWLGLVCGGLGTFTMFFFMGDMFKAMEGTGQGQMPPGFGQTMGAVMIGFSLLFYVLIPGTLLYFYSRRSVKATCEYYNPTPSWTDACPMPVLIQTVLLSMYAVGILSMAGYHWATPFFGTTLSGAPGAAVILLISISCALLARGSYRLHPAAWWGTVALILFWSASAWVTFTRASLMDFYAVMGIPEIQLEALRPMIEGGAMRNLMLWTMPFWMVIVLGFFAYTRRYFFPPDQGHTVQSA